MHKSPGRWLRLANWRYLPTHQANALTAMNLLKKNADGVTPTAGKNMNKDKIKNTFDEFKNRDEDRVKEMQKTMIEQGGDLGPDLVLLMMVDRLKDLSTLVAVIAKELIAEENYDGQKH